MLIDLLSAQSKLPQSVLEHYAETASKRYKVYEIPKKNGGERLIEHPSRPLKAIQRWIINNLFAQMPVHVCATAYKKGASIKNNAELHRGTAYTVRIDFRSFFPSFKEKHVKKFLAETPKKIFELSDADIKFVAKIVCRNRKLTIGAPTSPILTNAMMYGFDETISRWCHSIGLIYSRYADDIFVSAREPHILSEVEARVGAVAKKYKFASLEINRSKTANLSKKSHRSVAGLVLTSDNRVSVGRKRKRSIRSLIHLHLSRGLFVDELDNLLGLLGFIRDAEPTFLHSLRAKFNIEDIEVALRAIKPKFREDRLLLQNALVEPTK